MITSLSGDDEVPGYMFFTECNAHNTTCEMSHVIQYVPDVRVNPMSSLHPCTSPYIQLSTQYTYTG
jgi:hypothetical protein